MVVQKHVGRGPRSAALFAVLGLAIALTGCTNEKTRNIIDEQAGKAQQTLGDARQPNPAAKRYDPLVVDDRVWAGADAVRMHRGMPLPPRFETTHGITLISGEAMSLTDIATAITTQTGIPVRVDLAGVKGASGAPSGGSPAPNASAANGAAGSNAPTGSPGGIPIAYEGPLSGLLEKAVGWFGVGWRFDGTTIKIARYETKVFTIESMPGTQETTDSTTGTGTSSASGSSSGGGGMSSSSSSSSSGSGGATTSGSLSQTANFTANYKYWDELKDVLVSMLGGDGSVILSPSSGTAVVTTTPEVMRTVSDYLAKENRRSSSQIAINVEVYSLSLTEGEDFNIAFTGLLNQLGKIANIQYSGPQAPTSAGLLSNLGQFSVTILNPNNRNFTNPVSDVFNALSSIGDATSVAQFPMTTLNNRPVSRFVGTTKSYVQSVTNNTTAVATTAATTGTSASAIPINQGFTLQLTPRILDDGRIILQYSLSIQNIVSIQSFNTCTGAITTDGLGNGNSNAGCPSLQEPETTQRNFIQQSVLRSGSTLMIAGVDEEDVNQNAQGVGNPFNFLFGGGTSNAKTRTMVFIAITPQVLDTLPTEQAL